jgi:cyclopentanol dehydrogenase
MTAGADPRVITSVPLGRIAEPADVAPVITFLLSPASGYLTGAELVADGGVLAPYA